MTLGKNKTRINSSIITTCDQQRDSPPQEYVVNWLPSIGHWFNVRFKVVGPVVERIVSIIIIRSR